MPLLRPGVIKQHKPNQTKPISCIHPCMYILLQLGPNSLSVEHPPTHVFPCSTRIELSFLSCTHLYTYSIFNKDQNFFSLVQSSIRVYFYLQQGSNFLSCTHLYTYSIFSKDEIHFSLMYSPIHDSPSTARIKLVGQVHLNFCAV